MCFPTRATPMLARCVLLALALITIPSHAALADADPVFDARFDFLYVEANEGEASAGHVAVVFGDRTYDFGRREDGLLTLDRSPSSDFRFRYCVRGNRTIHRLHVAVTTPTRDLLRDAFDRRYDVQQRDLALLAAAH